MDFGIRVDEQNKAYCASCGAHVGDNGKAQMNFCPKCGMHLKLNAAALYDGRIKKGQIEILYQVLDEIEETARPATEIIEDFVKELAKD